MNAHEFLIGLDIGGTATRAVLFRHGQPLREARAASSNVQNVTVSAATAALRDVFEQLGAPPETPVLAGAGGVDTPHDAARLQDLVRCVTAAPPEVPITAVHDTRLILAAGGHTTGIAVIAGTGSVAWGVDAAGHEHRAGGWGYLLGDEGSGYWLGREAVRAVLRSDQQEPQAVPSDFARAVMAHAGANSPVELIAAFHDRPDRTEWAALSRTVVEHAQHGDPTAQDLVLSAARELHGLTVAVAQRLGGSPPVVLGGGLACTTVGGQLRRLLTDSGFTRVSVLRHEPAMGAPVLARALWGG